MINRRYRIRTMLLQEVLGYVLCDSPSTALQEWASASGDTLGRVLTSSVLSQWATALSIQNECYIEAESL